MLIDTKDIRFYNQPMLKKSLSFIILFFFIVSSLGVKNVLAQSVADNSQVQEELDSQATETTNIQAPEAANAQETVAQENLQKLPEEQKAVEQAAPEPTPMAAAAKIVKSIDIQGNKSIGVAQVLAKIKTRVGQEYQENVVSDDLKRLYNTGHFSDVQIDHEGVDH